MRPALIFAFVLGLALPASAQIRIPLSSVDYSGSGLAQDRAHTTDRSHRTALEEPVDRNLYRIVPGDRLTVGIWGERPQVHELEVTPEGVLIIPQAGPGQVAGRTLARAEEKLRSRLRRLYPGSRITLGLREPGLFRVAVTGAVKNPGWYELTGLDRISAALESAGGLRSGGSLRSIHIHRDQSRAIADQTPDIPEPESLDVDLLPWLLVGNLAANPRLEPGWRIEVPPLHETVTIIGAVNGRGPATEREASDQFAKEEIHAVEWRPGDTAEYALKVVGGLSAVAEGSIEILRTDGTIQKLNAANRTDLLTNLEKGDRLEVAYRQQWVYVVGAVRRPGRYPQYAGYSARDYVLMAGGEAENGSREGWTLTLPGESETRENLDVRIEAGSTLRVPERRSYWLTRVITPIASAVAVGISIAVLVR